MDSTFAMVRAAWQEAGWPGVEEGTSYGTPALKVRGKLLVRVREPDVLVLFCSLEEKEVLKHVAPEVFFETPHYHGYPAVLARASKIEPSELSELIERRWYEVAGAKLIRALEERPKKA